MLVAADGKYCGVRQYCYSFAVSNVTKRPLLQGSVVLRLTAALCDATKGLAGMQNAIAAAISLGALGPNRRCKVWGEERDEEMWGGVD